MNFLTRMAIIYRWNWRMSTAWRAFLGYFMAFCACVFTCIAALLMATINALRIVLFLPWHFILQPVIHAIRSTDEQAENLEKVMDEAGSE